jgi:DNA-directed RNA polymerase subunit RPC12/RpoP
MFYVFIFKSIYYSTKNILKKGLIMKNFIKINEEFTCKNCGHKNEKHQDSCRNHCVNCLYSLHVDDTIPGDRASKCHGLMKPESIDSNGKKGFIIVHKCTKCGKTIKNKVAPDDNQDTLIQISISQRINE